MNECLIFETFNAVKDLKRDSSNGLMTLSGVFGECGVRNNNNRVYEKANYGKMVKEMQDRIKRDGGIAGELEHPQTMNITTDNISHKITNIEIDENGVVSGTIQLLNTPKGKIAQAIVEGGLPLFVSSRAMGQVDKSGNVTLEKLSTFDIVSSPGFSSARMHLNESQVCESLTDNIFIISENKPDEDMENNQELLDKFNLLEARISDLENENAKLREEVDEALASKIDIKKLSDGVQNWCINEFAPKIQEWITEEYQGEMLNETKKMIVKDIAPKIQQWVVEEYSQGIEKWVTEEYTPVVEKWVCEQYSPTVEEWVIKQVAPGIQSWMVEHFAPEVENWVTESYGKTVKDMISEGLKDTRAGQLKSITETLTMLEGLDVKKPVYQGRQINENAVEEPLYIAQMPEDKRVQWNMASQEVKESIQRRAKIFDFTNEGAIERFWNGVNFETIKPTNTIYEGLDTITDQREREIRAQFRRSRLSRQGF